MESTCSKNNNRSIIEESVRMRKFVSELRRYRLMAIAQDKCPIPQISQKKIDITVWRIHFRFQPSEGPSQIKVAGDFTAVYHAKSDVKRAQNGVIPKKETPCQS